MKHRLTSALSQWRSLRRLYRVLIITFLSIALFVSVLPWMVERGLEYALVKQGAQTAKVENIDINLFTGRLGIDNLTIVTEDKRYLSLGHFQVDLDWLALFQKRIRVENLILQQTDIEILLEPNHFIMIGGIKVPLTKEDAQAAKSEQVENKPFDWGIGIAKLSLLQSDLVMKMPKFDKRIRFDKVTVSNAFNWRPDDDTQIVLEVQIGEGRIDGQFDAKPFAQTQAIKGQVKLSGWLLQAYSSLIPSNIEVLDGRINGRLNLEATNHQGNIQANQNGYLSLEKVAFKQTGLDVKTQHVMWQGEMDVSLKQGVPEVKTEGEWTIEKLALHLPEQTIGFTQLDWDNHLHLTMPNDAPAVKTKGHLRLQGLQFSDSAKRQAKINDLSWQNETQFRLEKQQPIVNTAGTVELNQVFVDDAMHHIIDLDALKWEGQVGFEASAKEPIHVLGKVTTEDVKVQNPEAKMQIAKLDTLQTELGFQSPLQLKLKQTQLTGLVIGKAETAPKPIVSLKAISLSDFLMVNPQHLELGDLELNGLDARLAVNQKKELTELDALMAAIQPPASPEQAQPENTSSEAKTTKPTEPKKDKPKSQAPKPIIRLADFKLTGDNHVFVETLATRPAMRKDIQIETLTLGELDSRKPTQNTPLVYLGKIDKYTKTSIKGNIQPFNPKVNTDLDIRIEDMDLYSFSPLIRRDLGYRIQSGSLNMESDIEVKNNILKSKNHLKLIGFEMEAESVETKKVKGKDGKEKTDVEVSTRSLSSMSLALDMLRDSNNNIDLNVPVEGNLASPDFDAKQVINVAIMNALKGGTKVALVLALQPYGAIYMATEYAYKKASEVTLQPVEFKPGTPEMTDDMPDYLTKMATLLKDKPSLALKVCGYHNQADRTQLEKAKPTSQQLAGQLYQLAKSRQNKVKDWLVEKEGIASSRLTTCHPQFEKTKVPGVNLLM